MTQSYSGSRKSTNTPVFSIDLIPFPNTEIGDAERLIALFGIDIRHCPEMKCWLIWDGCRWRKDRSSEMYIRVKETLRTLYLQAAKITESDKRKVIEAHARSSERAVSIRAILECARSESGVSVAQSELDANPDLLNCINGTIDLRLGEGLREHRREDLITKCCPVHFEPAVECPYFDEFIDRILGRDRTLITYVQRALGYALTGRVSEKALFCFFGDGNNGKTTLLELFRHILGDYAGQVMIDSLLRVRGEHSSTANADLADLRGARFVTTSETQEGSRLSEAMVKQLTGMGQLKTCRKYENPIEFPATFKIFMDSNHKPEVRGNDKAIWNRLRPIPFATIPESEIDKNLLDKMKAEASGVLTWAVVGCLEWQADGSLGTSPKIAAELDVWKASSDPFGAFLNERCALGVENWCMARDLDAALEEWNFDLGSSLTGEQLKKRLRELGCQPGRKSKGARIWKGISIRSLQGDGVTAGDGKIVEITDIALHREGSGQTLSPPVTPSPQSVKPLDKKKWQR